MSLWWNVPPYQCSRTVNYGFSLVLEPRRLQNCTASVKIMPPATPGAVSIVPGERQGCCGPDVQQELAASVRVVGRVKLERAAHWECSSSFWKDGHQLLIYVQGTDACPATMWAALLPGFDLQRAPAHSAFKHTLSSSSLSTVLKLVL